MSLEILRRELLWEVLRSLEDGDPSHSLLSFSVSSLSVSLRLSLRLSLSPSVLFSVRVMPRLLWVDKILVWSSKTCAHLSVCGVPT